MKTLVIANQKGGVGKTALVAHLAFDFAERGLRVLVVDLDTQANASFTLRNHTILGEASALFAEKAPKVVGKPGINLFRADAPLANLESKNLQDSASRLRNNFRALGPEFDVCVIDTAPALGVRLVAALVSADFVLSPIELEAYSLQGIRMMVSTIQNVRKGNPALKFLGILPSKVDSRNPRHQAHLTELRTTYKGLLIPTAVGLRSSVADALALGEPVWTIRKTAARKAIREMREVAEHLHDAMKLNGTAATHSETMSKTSSRSSSSTLGLDGLGDLSALLEAPAASGRPLELNLEEITEDPNQPRVEFDEESLAELADSIRARGVKTPISVRPVKKGSGYMINHGARRFRASRLAGLATVPAYVDDDYTDEDQIIENIHRDALRPREIADYIGRKLAQGKPQKDIAKGLGKSKGWVSQHAVLLDLPEPIAAAFNEGRATDVTAIYELVNCHKDDPEGTVSWMAAQEISRGTVKKLKDYIATRQKDQGAPPKFSKADGRHPNPDEAAPASTLRKPVIGVECEQKKGTLLYTKRPTKSGYAWVRLHNTEKEVKIDKIKLISLSNP